MVTSINRKLASSSAAIAAIKTGGDWKPEEFVALADRIKAGVTGYMELAQTGSIAMLEHLEAHGNINVIKPMFEAAKSFNPGLMNKTTNVRRDGSMARKWRAFIVAHSWLVYNPNNLKGSKLASATFVELWAKDKTKKMNVDGAKLVKWYDYQIGKSANAKAVPGVTVAERLRKAVQALINKRLVTDTAGNVLTVGRVRSLIVAELEKLEGPAKPVVVAGKTVKKATKPVAAKGSKPRKSSRVSGPPTANLGVAA